MIALGGMIGTGLFFGSAKAIHLTGPSIILAYILGGIIVYIIMRALGEMTVDNPNCGSFSEYATRYVNKYAGFISGWSAWFQYTVVCMVELTAVTMFLDAIIPGIPHWLVCAIILIFFTAINLLSVKVFGEFEFWFAGIKVFAIILMLIFSAYLLFFKHAINPELYQYTNPNLFFASGLNGFMMSLVIVVFSFGGSEFISIAAGETENPKQNIPKAINGVIFRIIIFYVLTMLAIILLYPYQKLSQNISPFVDIFSQIGFKYAAVMMSIVAITAALSAFNSCLYGASRMLFNLSRHGFAHKSLSSGKNAIPAKAILFTSSSVVIAIIVNYLFPEKALMYLLTIATSAILIVWFMILITQICFRKHKNMNNLAIDYKLGLFPYLNILAIAFLLVIMSTMLDMQEMRLSVYVTPLWIITLSIFYALSEARYRVKNIKNKL